MRIAVITTIIFANIADFLSNPERDLIAKNIRVGKKAIVIMLISSENIHNNIHSSIYSIFQLLTLICWRLPNIFFFEIVPVRW